MPIAELFLGALLPMLFERLASRELLNFARREGIDKLLKKWEKKLISINQVLDEAEDRQLTGDRGVKLWLEDLRDLAYDMEDLLDEFATKSAEDKFKAELGNSKVLSCLPSCCFKLCPSAFMFDHKMRSTIKEMDGKLQDVITQKDNFDFGKNNGNRSANRRQDKQLATTHLPEAGFVSREDEKSEILELLTRDEDERTCANIKVIPIVGMGGVGKTALTQQIYNDSRVTDYFNVRAWACVSEDYNELAITKSILGITNHDLSCEGKDLNWLQDKLKESLYGKKFLVVLDDVWNEKYGNWTSLLKPFQSGVKGSKIILTTRNRGVALLADPSPYCLKELSQDACMTLFTFHALGVKNFDHHPNLEALGQEIVKKCKGLPLAVKTLAGLLRNKVNPQEWEAILNSKIWDLPEERNEILPALKLSYLHLPSDLRRCFAYCAIFPKDYEIERDDLIHWWIADGLLEVKEAKNRWNAGLNYFNELVSRSLFQKLSINGSQFLMHDLVNDLAKLVAGATYFSPEEFEFEGNQSNASFARHASFIPSDCITPGRLKIYHQMKGLRSFISLVKLFKFDDKAYLSEKVLCDLLSGLKYLRVLSLCRYHIINVPDGICKLKHLRHLNLSYTDIEILPKSIVALYNLEALMLRGCEKLSKLPESMEKLINLKFLDITSTLSLRAMPLYIGKLAGLEMLSKFVVGTENGSRLNELKNLKNLKGELCIFDLRKVQKVEDAMDTNLLMKEGICRLTMEWSSYFENSQNEELEAQVLDFLRPHQNLENLVISYYGGLKFPSWLESPPHLNIKHLRLHGCRRANTLPSLGQLSSLKELYIEGLHALCTIGYEFYGNDKSPFPSLITLEFKHMKLWKDWSHCDGIEEVGVLFPRLEHLLIQDCPLLIGKLPSQLGSLTKLEIKSCPRMDALPSVISLPSLKELKSISCNEGVLKSLINLTSLTSLVIEDASELTCLNHGFTSSLIKLEELHIERCKKLTYLWQDRDVIQNLGCLKKLSISACHEFMYFVAEEGDIELLGNLETIHLSSCSKLEKLPSKMHTLYSLRDLSVQFCSNLVSFPETGIPTSMISLQIVDCDRLQHLPRGLNVDPDEVSTVNTQGDKMSGLQSLMISQGTFRAAALFNGAITLPITLKSLKFHFCQNEESLERINIDCLQSLQDIEIWGCHKLRSLPQGLNTLFGLNSLYLYHLSALEVECFPPLPPGISRFILRKCSKIKSLPNQLHRLTSLQYLEIRWCESITRFPDGGLPPQLQELEVSECENMKQPMSEWLTPLPSLQKLEIDCSVGGVGEEEDLVLPLFSSLLELDISNMGKVKRLSSSLPPSLQILRIGDYGTRCPELRELPQDGLPPSLRELRIINCPKLRELPQDRLPPSLEQLLIKGCGILEERCRKGTGSYWPLIHEIPRVRLCDSPMFQSIT